MSPIMLVIPAEDWPGDSHACLLLCPVFFADVTVFQAHLQLVRVKTLFKVLSLRVWNDISGGYPNMINCCEGWLLHGWLEVVFTSAAELQRLLYLQIQFCFFFYLIYLFYRTLFSILKLRSFIFVFLRCGLTNNLSK